MLPPGPKAYLLKALAGTPDVVESLLRGLDHDSAKWDVRPEPERFTLREIIAHLADWESIWLDRAKRTRDENTPVLPNKDEVQYAIDNNYAKSDPLANIVRFRAGRAALCDCLLSLTDSDWQRIAQRELLGPMNLEEQTILILAHDGYHTSQIAQWVKPFK